MYPISARALAALGQSHNVTGRLLASVNRSPFTYPVKLVDGSVKVDGASPIRRNLDALIIAKPGDPECDVFQTEIRAQYGISIDNFTWEWITVGTFVVTGAKEIGPGQIQIKGEDRWRRVADARFLRPVRTSGQHRLAIESLIEAADGRILCTDYSGKTSTHRTSLWERDRDKAIRDLGNAIGVDVFFNPDGAAEIRNTASIAATSVWSIFGGDGGTLIEPRREMNRDKVYNAVVVEGEDASGNVSVRAEAKVSDPASKLLFGAAAGQKPRFFRSSLITTQTQAQNTANSMLAKVSGVPKSIGIDAFVNPALEAGDTVYVEIEPGKHEYHLVESFTIPLGPGGTTIATRAALDPEGA